MKRPYRLEAVYSSGDWERVDGYHDQERAVRVASWLSDRGRSVRVIDTRTGEVIYPKEPS